MGAFGLSVKRHLRTHSPPRSAPAWPQAALGSLTHTAAPAKRRRRWLARWPLRRCVALLPLDGVRVAGSLPRPYVPCTGALTWSGYDLADSWRAVSRNINGRRNWRHQFGQLEGRPPHHTRPTPPPHALEPRSHPVGVRTPWFDGHRVSTVPTTDLVGRALYRRASASALDQPSLMLYLPCLPGSRGPTASGSQDARASRPPDWHHDAPPGTASNRARMVTYRGSEVGECRGRSCDTRIRAHAPGRRASHGHSMKVRARPVPGWDTKPPKQDSQPDTPAREHPPLSLRRRSPYRRGAPRQRREPPQRRGEKRCRCARESAESWRSRTSTMLSAPGRRLY